jgi:hypothetical protein
VTEPTASVVTAPDWLARSVRTIPWSEAEGHLRAARNYWVASLRPDGMPHTRPVWGAWVDQRLVLSAGGGYWTMRNLRSHPLLSAHPEPAEGFVVVVEGHAAAVTDAGPDHMERTVNDYNAKYEWDIDAGEFERGIELVPTRAYAWRTGARGQRDFRDYDATRYDFS